MRTPDILLTSLVSGILTLAIVNARGVVVTVDTRDNDNERPADPLFACSEFPISPSQPCSTIDEANMCSHLISAAAVTSQNCMNTSTFTNLPYTGGLRLSTCHHANNLKQLLGRLLGKHHEFSNSFWAYCDPGDEECEEYVEENEDYLDGIAQVSPKNLVADSRTVG